LDPVIAPVAIGALGELIATSVAASAGRTWKSVKGKPEAQAVRAAIDAALTTALRDAAHPSGSDVDDAWLAEVAKMWRPAFTAQVSKELVACIGDPSRDRAYVTHLATDALVADGCDLAQLGRTFWVEEFLAVLPRRLFECLRAESLRDDRARGLVDHLFRQRADARIRQAEPATPREFRDDLKSLLGQLDERARTGRLPPYLPKGADIAALSRTVRVRPGIRSGLADRVNARDSDPHDAGRAYRLPGERSDDSEPPRPWSAIVAEHQQVVVLADPGLGKSWLIRTETHRLAQAALARLEADSASVIVPVPVRCDQLAAAEGQDLADKAAAHLTAQRLLPPRSRPGLAEKVRSGQAVLLLDALDELTAAESGELRELVRSWADQAGQHARCVITSRIAGYTGPPVPSAHEVELQAFTPDDVKALVGAWPLSAKAAHRLLDRTSDPPIAAMARIPLLLALLCSLAASLPAGEALPKTRGQLYDRILRWFLTQVHRSTDNPQAPTLNDVDVDSLLEILAPLAFIFASQDEGWIDLMPAERLLTAIRAAGQAFTERRRPAGQVLQELSVGAGILVPDGDPSAGRSPNYLFLHRTIAEYLVARHLATLPEPDRLAIVDQHRWFDPDWAEVIPMLGERLNPVAASRLIQHFLADECDPFHHSLYTAIRIWGARSDADHLLTAGQAVELAGRVVHLICHKVTHRVTITQLTAMTYLPDALRTQLLDCLADDDADLRAAGALALAGREDPAVTAALLHRLIADDIWYVRIGAAQALAGREDPAVTAALLHRLTADDIWSVRKAAAEALVGREDPAVTAALLDCLAADDQWLVRKAAAAALDGRDDPAVTAALVDCLAADDVDTREVAAAALDGRQDPAVTAALLDCLAANDERDEWSVRKAVAEALAGREDPAVTAALLHCLTADNIWPVRQAAAEALVDREDPALIPALLNRLAADDEWSVRYGAVKALAGREDPTLIPALLDCLDAEDTVTRRAAVLALADWQTPEVTEALLDCLEDDDGMVCSRAARALAGREDPAVIPALLECLDDEDSNVCSAAIKALAGREDPAVIAALLDCLHDYDPYVRGAAIAALARRGDPALSVLLDCLHDHDAEVRRCVVEALARREDPSVIPALLDCLDDDDGDVSAAAERVLAARKAPRDLLTFAIEAQRLNPSSLLWVIGAAERLMTRHYQRLEPSEQLAVSAAMGRLTVTALTESSPGPLPRPAPQSFPIGRFGLEFPT
jgi:HEAT repeat protein